MLAHFRIDDLRKGWWLATPDSEFQSGLDILRAKDVDSRLTRWAVMDNYGCAASITKGTSTTDY